MIQKNVEQLSENFISEKDVKNFVIYKGQKLEADIAYIEIYQHSCLNSYADRWLFTGSTENQNESIL